MTAPDEAANGGVAVPFEPQDSVRAQVNSHWLWNGDTGWECTGCNWAGDKLEDFYSVHERPTDDIQF